MFCRQVRTLVICSIVFALSATTSAQPTRLRVNMGASGEVATLDSLQVRSAAQSRFIKNLTRGLVTLNHAGRVVGDLAVSWRSERGHETWWFVLQNAQFSDGSPLTCADVAASFERGRTHRDAIHFDFGLFTAVSCESPTRLRLQLREPMPDLVSQLSSAELRVLSPADAAAPLGQQTFEVTSGAYRLLARMPQALFALNRYFPAAPNAPEEVEVTSMEASAAMAALQAGQLDVAFAPTTLTAAQHREITAAGQVAVHDFQISFSFWISINEALIPSAEARMFLQRVVRPPASDLAARAPVWLPASQLVRDDGAGRIEAAWLSRFWQQGGERPELPPQIKLLLPSSGPLNDMVVNRLQMAGLQVAPTYYESQAEFAATYRTGGFHLYLTNNDYGRRDPSGGLLVTLAEARPLVLLATPDDRASWTRRLLEATSHTRRMRVARELSKMLLEGGYVIPLGHYQNLLYYNRRVNVRGLATTFADVSWWKMRLRR